MDLRIEKHDWGFMFVCIGLAIVAELSFLHGQIGVSYLVFITCFYAVFFIRFRNVAFTNRRIGLLLTLCIWMLAASYLLYDRMPFYLLNIFVIPGFIFFHIVLVTAPKQIRWSSLTFVTTLFEKIGVGVAYDFKFFTKGFRKLFKNMEDQTASQLKRVLIGLLIGIPLLLFVTGLLMSADAVFENIIGSIPRFIVQLNMQEQVFRTIAVIIYFLVIFGILQVLIHYRSKQETQVVESTNNLRFDSVIVMTILGLLTSVYLLFTAIQFTYFFGGLKDGLTYAEYARKGFSELVVVTLVNWTILISCLKFVKKDSIALKVIYSLIIVFSGVMLASAYQRLSLYESAYGFTLDRIFAHAFMIFLFIIFAYTLIRVWLVHLSLLHFYLITGFLFYTALNIMPLEQMIVDNNLERYENTGKIDIFYLQGLGATGIEGLVNLYERDPDYPELSNLLSYEKQELARQQNENWQSYNLAEQSMRERLADIKVSGE
ncbi:DUF4153 domain-containing protein [Radiobacillus sp. PE A8.2]|uniref:DUF4153 domain-containing protein n=1 Tax=Radiobacillus sp. PE A8.2 TaxID=3380349 RepID=UPI00389083B6